LKRVKINQVIYFLNLDFYMKCFLIPKLMLIAKIAMSQIMLPAYQGVVSKISTVNVMSCPGLATVTDIDNNIYNTVLIGTQCWMASNLRVSTYNTGVTIPLDVSGGSGGTESQTWNTKTTGARTTYAHNSSNLTTYGYLYNWYAATDTKKICPTGWHVPTTTEWTTLTTYLGGITIAGGDMKSTGSTLWTTPNTGADNSSGFSALPGGVRWTGAGGAFGGIRDYAYFWSTTANGTAAWYRRLSYLDNDVFVDDCGKPCGHSVRCLRD
jgi:uncharacterized protein (TIGR02145 family)